MASFFLGIVGLVLVLGTGVIQGLIAALTGGTAV